MKEVQSQDTYKQIHINWRSYRVAQGAHVHIPKRMKKKVKEK